MYATMLEVVLAMLLKLLFFYLAMVRPSAEWIGFTAVLSTPRKRWGGGRGVYAYFPFQRQVTSICTPSSLGGKDAKGSA